MTTSVEGVGQIDLSHLSLFLLQCPEARRWGNGMPPTILKDCRQGPAIEMQCVMIGVGCWVYWICIWTR